MMKVKVIFFACASTEKWKEIVGYFCISSVLLYWCASQNSKFNFFLSLNCFKLKMSSEGILAVYQHKKKCAALACSLLIRKRRRMQQRKIWVKQWISRRNMFSIEENLLRELSDEDENCYRNFVRMSIEDFTYLLQKVAPIITKQDTNMREAISARTRLILTLRFLATGDSYASLMYLFRIGRSTIGKIVKETVAAIYTVLKDEYLRLPTNENEWLEISHDFEMKWNFPNCIGALDGKHITIKAPNNSISDYFNYKKQFSIVLMAMCDANYKFTYINVGAKGRHSDGGVFAHCALSKQLYQNELGLPMPRPLMNRSLEMPFVIVADDAFPLTEHIMKPYGQKNLSIEKRIYNYRLSRTRRIIENVFGIASARFRVLRRTAELPPEVVSSIVCAICTLHNFLLSRNSRKTYAPPGTFDSNDALGSWRDEEHTMLQPLENTPRRPTQQAIGIQSEFMEYFNNEGAVEWQMQNI